MEAGRVSYLCPDSVEPRYSGIAPFLELGGVELDEIAHVRRRFAGELEKGVCPAVVTPLLVQLGHGGEMIDNVFRKPQPPKAFAPGLKRDVAISDGPAESV